MAALPDRPTTATRAFGAVLTASGAVLLFAGPAVARLAGGTRRGTPDSRIVRLLGARQTAQGLVVLASPGPASTTLGVVADLSHAASMVALAAFWPRFRRAALLSAAGAVASAGAGAGLVASGRRAVGRRA